MRESRVQHDIMLEFGARPNIRLWRTNTGALFDSRGQLVRYGVLGGPDVTGILGPHGRYLGIECKAPGGKQSKEQLAFQRMVVSLGGLYVVAYSIEDVELAL